jgi:hypothetical protein
MRRVKELGHREIECGGIFQFKFLDGLEITRQPQYGMWNYLCIVAHVNGKRVLQLINRSDSNSSSGSRSSSCNCIGRVLTNLYVAVEQISLSG